MDREDWRLLAARHGQDGEEPRRCRDCRAYWPCDFRLRAEVELAAHLRPYPISAPGQPVTMAG
ncbi:hypothetical protein [Micromonospora sp. NPDC047134]|uniref:hypothetical protein n=1 Tax=Micromonospora sp. NPDC047134 TaxID=3154340 RepID=UPI0033F199ED